MDAQDDSFYTLLRYQGINHSNSNDSRWRDLRRGKHSAYQNSK